MAASGMDMVASASRVAQVDAARLDEEYHLLLLEQLNFVMSAAPPDARRRLSVRLLRFPSVPLDRAWSSCLASFACMPYPGKV
jgi:hypothetical protein